MSNIPAKTDDKLFHLAFDNSAQPNIISVISTGKIITVNSAACKLLGYSKKELLTKKQGSLFDIKDSRFKKMMKEGSVEGSSVGTVKAIRKTGQRLCCEITSAVFIGEHGIKKSITTIADLTGSINQQKQIDARKDKIVADNIEIAKTAEKKSAVKKDKIAAGHIASAIEKQKSTNILNEKLVANVIKSVNDASAAKTVANNAWIKYIAKTSYDVMWDWDIITGNIYVGDSVEEVFGYKMKNDTISFTKFKKVVATPGSFKVLRKLMKALKSDQKSWTDTFTVKRQDGSLACVNSRGCIVRDTNGTAIRMIGAAQDISKLRELENTINEQQAVKKENDEMFHLAAKLSYDGIWDWNIITNEFFLGEGFEHLFGYTITKEKNTTFNWMEFLHPDDRDAVEKGFAAAIVSGAMSWEHAYRFIRADGTIANVYGRASIIRDKKGKAIRMIGAIHDLSRQKELEQKLESEILSTRKLKIEYKENLRLMFNSSSDVLYDIDLATDEIILSEGYEKEFGYPIHPQMTVADVWVKHLHPEDKDAVLADYKRMLSSAETKWKYSYRFIRADGSTANILSSRIVLRTTDGKAYRMIGSMQDISKQTGLEEKLEKEIKLKENQINDAMLDANESARSDIGKELHDNVNQLLGVSRLYLEMAKQGGPESPMHLARSSEYTTKAIEEIRKLSKGLSTDSVKHLGLCFSIENLASVTMDTHPVKIISTIDPFIENRLHDKFKLNLFRIIQEQLNNIVKHAFAKNVSIILSQNKKSVILTIKDDGIGFDTGKKRKGVGIENIKSRAATFHGDTSFVSATGKGCTLTIHFAVTDSLLQKN